MSRVYYFHYCRYGWNDWYGQIVYTFAIRQNEAGSIEVAYAKCSKHDRFVRKTGREIAASRLGRTHKYSYRTIGVPLLHRLIKDLTSNSSFANHVGYVCRKLD